MTCSISKFEKYFKSKKVLITGNTGFKGSWLSVWLLELGANVVGFSNGIPTEPSHFAAAKLEKGIRHYVGDLKDPIIVQSVLEETQPDFVFHLAAQALVRRSYTEPLLTFQTNVMGTANLLESLRKLKKPCVTVLITSDKCYDNVEWIWGYRETDRLGGKDPYSASKGAAEIIIRSYVESFMREGSPIRVGIGRAGNVIGGGDWAEGRIIPDCMRAWSLKQKVAIRNPASTRPWQHVLEPLSGYLTLASTLTESSELHGEAFNFGPLSSQNHSVQELLDCFQEYWQDASWESVSDMGIKFHEAGLLKLNCDKALHLLKWQPTLGFSDTVRFTAKWYQKFYDNSSKSIFNTTRKQLREYVALAKSRQIPWAI